MARRAEARWVDTEAPALLKRRRAAMRRRQRSTFHDRDARRTALRSNRFWRRYR